MRKIDRDEAYSADISEWSFPKAESLKIATLTVEQEQAFANKKSILEAEFQKKEAQRQVELESYKKEYEEKILLLNHILTQIENPLIILNEELMDLIQEAIKKTVKNIIYREIKADPKILNKMIEELKELISSHNGLLTVFLSEVDYQRFSAGNKSNALSVKVNPALNEGDVIIKSNSAEIRALLTERVDRLIGKKK